jgi:hypothetical protein
MAVCVGDLDPRQVERLRVALAEAIAAHFAYPPFFVYRAGRSDYRPLDRAKREQIADFLRSANFAPLDRVDVTSPEVRRFFERLFARFLQVNVDFAHPRHARRLPELQARAPKIAGDLQRGLLDVLSGRDTAFGARQSQRSWASNARPPRLPEDEIERRSRILETTLVRARSGELASFSVSMPAVRDPRAVSAVPPQRARGNGWPGAQGDTTVRVPAQGFAEVFGASAPSGQFPAAQAPLPARRDAVADQPTGPVPAVGRGTMMDGSGPHGTSGALSELPADLVQLYGDYLRDMQPDLDEPTRSTGAHVAAPAYAPRPAAPQPAAPQPASNGWASSVPSYADSAAIYSPSGEGRRDEAVFSQLRYQLEGFVRTAARSYGIPSDGKDPSTVLDFLRGSGFVDEADLRIAESILALTDRVAGNGMASLEDYRQALMLYLLYHRSHLGI